MKFKDSSSKTLEIQNRTEDIVIQQKKFEAAGCLEE
jgi:hypothetical protein